MFLFSPSRYKYLELNPRSFSTESEESEEFELFQLSTSKWASLPFIRTEGSTKSEKVFEEDDENLDDLSEEESELLFMGLVPKKRVTKLGTFCKRSCSSITAGLSIKRESPNLKQKSAIDLQSCSVSKVSFKIPSMETTAELTESSEEPVSNVLHPSGESTNTRSLIWRNLSFRRLLSHKSEGSYGSYKQESRTSTSNKASKPRNTQFMPRAFRLQPPKRPSKTYTWLGRAVLNFRSSVNMRAAPGFDFGDSNAWPA